MKNIILIPTYNEKDNIKLIVAEIFNLLPEIKILVIDDNSPDGTAEIVKSLMERHVNLFLLERQKKTGLGDAYKDAMSRVIKDREIDHIITMDADGSHSPEYLQIFLDKILQHDLVIGSRYTKDGGTVDWEVWRRYLSRFGNLYARFFTGLAINDFTAGFMCIRRELLERLDFNIIGSSGYSFQIELKFHLIHGLGARAFEIPIIFKSRREGESKLSKQIIREGIIIPLKLFLKRLWHKK